MKKQSQIKHCEICEEMANYLCLSCSWYYCESCFKFVHDKKAKSNHKKESIDPFVPIDTKCPDHPNNSMNLFCVDEKGNKLLIFYLIYRIMLCLLPL